MSSLLCCLCYGHMENVLFKDITQKKGYSRLLCISVNFYRCNNTSAAAAGGSLSLLSLVSVFPSHHLFFSLCRCLIRLVDDFLLITPDLHDAQAFLKYDTRQVFHTYDCSCDTRPLNQHVFLTDLQHIYFSNIMIILNLQKIHYQLHYYPHLR